MTAILRYSTRPFPSSRLLPEIKPRPARSPRGHSASKPAAVVVEALSTDKWFENKTYLHGVDLYNYHYWWESHEAWENLWKKGHQDKLVSEFLKGLIKTSAAFIKWRLKVPRGVKLHYQGAMGHLRKVCAEHPVYMGIDLLRHIERLERHFSLMMGVDVEKWPDPTVNYPAIELQRV